MIFKKLKIKTFFRRRKPRRSARNRLFRTKSNPLYLTHRDTALALVNSRAAHFSNLYNSIFADPHHPGHEAYRGKFSYKKITIRNQSSRWGSCSRKGNMNFNYRIALLPSEFADYIIVHELCHLAEFNHSKKFWDLVEMTVPNWQKLRNELKEYGKKLF